MFVEKALG